MLRTLLLITLFLLSISSFSQTYKYKNLDVVWTPESKESKKYVFWGLGAISSDQLIAVSREKPSMSNQRYSSAIKVQRLGATNLAVRNSKEIDLKGEGKNWDFLSTIELNNKLLIFSTNSNTKTNQHILYYQTLNQKTLAISKKKKIASIPIKSGASLTGGTSISKFGSSYSVQTSDDSTKLLVHYVKPTHKNDREKHGVIAFDQEMTLLWYKQITMPYLPKEYELEKVKVDNHGNLYLLGRIDKNKEDKIYYRSPDYRYELVTYRELGNRKKVFKLRIGEKIVNDVNMKFDVNGDLLLAGFYSNKSTFSTKGSYLVKLHAKTDSVLYSTIHPIDIELLTKHMTKSKEAKAKKKEAKGKEVEGTRLYLKHFVLKDDGGVILFGEEKYVRVKSMTSADGHVTNYTEYNFNNIVIFNISKEGKVIWANNIGKKQKTLNDGGEFSSFGLMVDHDQIYLLYNDNPENLFEQKQGKIHAFDRSKNTVAVLVKVANDGTITKKALYSSKDTKVLTKTRSCEQISDNELLLYGLRKKVHSFGKIVFK